ncbi:phosphoribosylanthranilate isomerase [Ammoniphilus sp. YIM 78166]|uniref:phosphoribosylanthranilate isomerase n=1 Tax=Ammoniphilus sp. YIM 78166 TaxID=1644106 RepID=UPI00106F743F|nr:phosphoribosylanthranilate isomerase [Ammoniphilus sp. YIM 78166]
MRAAPLVKCCGFKDAEGLSQLNALGVDFVGFILAPSKRNVNPADLPGLFQAVPAGMKKVGVFVNPSLSELADVMKIAAFDLIQLHGQESPDFCRQLKQEFSVDIIKAVHIGDGQGQVPPDEYGKWIDYLLLDTLDPQAAGGTGKTFRWDVIPMFEQWCKVHGVKLLVAGGITPENALQLISEWPLAGIDVASGIETDGRKDRLKIEKLVERVKGNGRST